jgi:hypothetical protein
MTSPQSFKGKLTGQILVASLVLVRGSGNLLTDPNTERIVHILLCSKQLDRSTRIG